MATASWTLTGGTGAWSTASDWTPAPPATGDSVLIGTTKNASSILVTEDVSTSMNSLTMAGKAGSTTTLAVTSGATLIVNGGISFGANTDIDGTGTLIANGAISGGGNITATSGLLDISGTGSIASNGAVLLSIGTTVASTLELNLSGGVSTTHAISINNANQTLEMGPTGTLTITTGESITNGTILLDGNALIDRSGLGIGAGATLIGTGTVTGVLSGTGTVAASGGILDLVTAVNSTGTNFSIDDTAGSVLELAGTATSGSTFTLAGPAGSLELGDVANGKVKGFNGTIAGLDVGSSTTSPTNDVNIQGTVTSAFLSGNHITVLNGTTTVATLQLSSAPAVGTNAFVSADSTLGGYDVFLADVAVLLPTASWSPAGETGVEGSAIALGTITATAGAVPLTSVLVSNIPVGDRLTDGTHSFTATTSTTSVNVLSWNDAKLSITPVNDANLTLSVQATDLAGNHSTIATETLTVDPLAPTVTPQSVSGAHGGPIALNLGITVNSKTGDTNSLNSVTISGIPAGATLSNSAGPLIIGGGSITFSAAQLAAGALTGLAITVPSPGSYSLGVSATEQNANGNPGAAGTGTDTVTVTTVAGPTVNWSPASEIGVEGSAIALGTIAATAGAHPVTSVVVSNIPVGDKLTDGAGGHSFTATAGTTSVNILGWHDTSLSITPSNDANFTLSVQATDSIGNASTIATEAVTADPEAPTVAPVAVSGAQNQPIGLDLGITVNGESGDANVLNSLTISDIPAGATLSYSGGTLPVSGGSISFNATQLADGALSGLAITLANTGTVQLGLSATEQDAGGDVSAAATGTETVTVTAAAAGPTVSWPAGPEIGVEGSTIALGAIIATAGANPLSSVVVSGIPIGDTLTDGTHSFTATTGTTSVNVLGWNDADLSITPINDGTITLSVQATDSIGNASTPAAEVVTADPEAPTVAPAAVSGAQGQPIALNLGITVNGESGDTNVLNSLTISGIPAGATLSNSAGPLSVSGGSISFTATQLADGAFTGLAITLANTGTVDLGVSATERDAGGDASAAATDMETVTVTAAAPTVPAYSHIVVVMEENHDYDEIIGNNAEAPFLNSLAAGGAVLANYHAITHPSQPNYFALYAGSTFGTTDDNIYSEPDPTLDTILAADGKTFIGYVDQSDSDENHNPWEEFPEGYSVQTDFGPTTSYPEFTSLFPGGNYSNLPTVSFVIPGIYNDMHTGTIQQGDSWLQSNLAAYAQWAVSNNSLLIVTWDENDDDTDDTEPTNQVPAILYGAGVVPGSYTTDYNHYNTLSTILAAYGLTAPNEAAGAPTFQVFDGDGETVNSSTSGPLVLSSSDNPLDITSTGKISSTGAATDGVDGPAGNTWAIENDGTVSSASALGISLQGGGSVTNGATSGAAATISGGLSGIAIYGAAGSIINDGKITGTSNDGVALAGTVTPFVYGDSAGITNSVTNAAGASISGGINGVYIESGTTGTVTNSGSINGSTGAGIDLAGGGSVSNMSSGSISAPGTAGGGLSHGADIYSTGAYGSVTNYGGIVGGPYGVALADGGSVTNSGLISGGKEGMIAEQTASTLSNSGTVNATTGDGVDLFAGGSVTNVAGGFILSAGTAATAVYVTGGSATISNAGNIVESNDIGILINAGGSITNAAGGTISGSEEGVFFKTDAGTLSNAGTITSPGTNGVGVYLENAGGATNLTGGSISGNSFGIFLEGEFSTLTNNGVITGENYDGIVLGLGGSVTNAAGASVLGGSNGVYVKYRAAGTVTNSGSIAGTSSAGIDLADGGSISNNATASVSGSAFGVFITNASGTVTNSGSITGTTSDGVDLVAGGTVINLALALISGGSNGVYVKGGGTVTNSGSITASSATGAGASLAGGSVTNNMGATISGVDFGVFVTGASGSVANSGSISGSHAVDLGAGGSLSNASSGSIVGAVAGLLTGGASATLTNQGSISATAGGGTAADIEAGGSITNNASASISGTSFGIFVTGGTGAVTNAGSISASSNIGIRLSDGGSVSNAAGASITGAGYGVYISTSGTVTNAGTISGTPDAVRFSGAGNDRVTIDPGAVFNGSVVGGSGTNTLELAAGTGSISLAAGLFTNFGMVEADPGSNWTLTNDDTASPDVFQLDNTSTFDVATALGTNAQISFASGSSELGIANFAGFGTGTGASYTGPLLENFVAGDSIDLQNLSAIGATFTLTTGSTTDLLQLNNSSEDVATLSFQVSSLGSGTFQVNPDHASGALLTLS